MGNITCHSLTQKRAHLFHPQQQHRLSLTGGGGGGGDQSVTIESGYISVCIGMCVLAGAVWGSGQTMSFIEATRDANDDSYGREDDETEDLNMRPPPSGNKKAKKKKIKGPRHHRIRIRSEFGEEFFTGQ